DAAGCAVGRRLRDVAGQIDAVVRRAVDERVHYVAVRRDRRELDLAELVLDPMRLGDAGRAALHGLTVRLLRVWHAQRDVLRAVAVLAREARDLGVLAHPARDDEADVALLEHVGRAIADARLGSC